MWSETRTGLRHIASSKPGRSRFSPASSSQPNCAMAAQRRVRPSCAPGWRACSKRSRCCPWLFPLPPDIPAAAGYGGIRAALEAAGQSIGMNDLLIAAHACALGLTLVTDDTREFSRIRDLKVENWLER